jgi:uncharacterized coiled-coil protein SlyX
MSKEPIGERVKALEVQFPGIKKQLEEITDSLHQFNQGLRKIQSQLARMRRLLPFALSLLGWLGSSLVLHTLSSDLARLFGIIWKAIISVI